MSGSLARLIGLVGVLGLAAMPAADGIGQSQQSGPYTVVASGQRFAALQQAVNAIGGGRGTVAIAPGTYRDCAVQTVGEVAFVAQAAGQVLFDAAICEGKAALVLRGRAARVEGLVFQNQRIAEGNGAGIRLEHGSLIVRQTWFRDSDQGILSADDPAGTVLIEASTFSRLGRCDHGRSCAHSVYFGNYGTVLIRHSRFEAGRGGHYVKSRAAQIEVSDSSFDDAQGRQTNYMIDLSTGASGLILGNWMVQGRDKANPGAFITNAAEGRTHSAEGLRIIGNVVRLAPGVARSAAMVADWSGDPIHLGGNNIGAGIRRIEHH
ncbi:right-handed parallel beta-helix repeat-containing protein [Novosphingobium sp. FKTRR1]|uniref:right-handed parallel beta-helix repeat-containing protein n=1 Tax=unclassified Novosphingobium TaxID=2644732 RepID=UPI001CEFC56C|nr:right-handed parallel beta-helix repeat-containing protein [Novosphingobium sp. FKTRR1]